MSKKIIKKILLIALTFLVFASALFIWKKAIKKESTRQITYDTTSALEKVLQISELYSYKTTYNGVAYVYDKDDSSKISYYVSYNSTVKVGINTEDIKVEADDENKKIIITLPQIMIKEVDVDMSSLDYMFQEMLIFLL